MNSARTLSSAATRVVLARTKKYQNASGRGRDTSGAGIVVYLLYNNSIEVPHDHRAGSNRAGNEYRVVSRHRRYRFARVGSDARGLRGGSAGEPRGDDADEGDPERAAEPEDEHLSDRETDGGLTVAIEGSR